MRNTYDLNNQFQITAAQITYVIMYLVTVAGWYFWIRVFFGPKMSAFLDIAQIWLQSFQLFNHISQPWLMIKKVNGPCFLWTLLITNWVL